MRRKLLRWPAERFSVWLGAAPAGVLTHGTHSGGVGAPPGGTMASRQELADVDVRSFRPVWTLASGMGQIP